MPWLAPQETPQTNKHSHQIEFPSILLPPDIVSGSIVDVDVSRNLTAETKATSAFNKIQSQILNSFGSEAPSTPILRCRNATQTSVVLEWDPISLATAKLRSLSLHRNGSKAGNIPRPLEMTSTKISGLAVDTEYNFNLVLRTSAGTYSSERLVVRTHKMTDLTGITITPGVMPVELRESLESTVQRMGAKLIETVRIDTTHFVCTEGRGSAWEKALEMNVAVVTPDWVKGCEREGRLVGVRGYYLNADPKLRQMGPGTGLGLQRENSSASLQTQQQQRRSVAHVNVPRTEVTPPTPDRPSTRDFRTGSRGGEVDGQRTAMSAVPQPQGERESAPSPKAQSPVEQPRTPVERPQTPPAQTASEEEKPQVPVKDETAQVAEKRDEADGPSRDDSPVENSEDSNAAVANVNGDMVEEVSHEAGRHEGEQAMTAVENGEKEVVDEVQVTAAVEDGKKNVMEEMHVDGDITDAKENQPTTNDQAATGVPLDKDSDGAETAPKNPTEESDEAESAPMKMEEEAEKEETRSKKSRKNKKSKNGKTANEETSTVAEGESFDDVAL